MLEVYLSFIAILILLVGFLIYYYSDPRAAIYAKLLVFVSFTTSLLCFVLLPIDIYQSSLEDSNYEQIIRKAWKIIFYINFFLCWLILPFAQEYQDSGQFSFGNKIKESFLMNGILIGVLCGGAILVVIYLLVAQKFTFSQLPDVFATLVNIFGLSLVTIFMGYGLLSFPKEFHVRRDHKRLVKRCHKHAEAIKDEQQNIIEQIFTIQKILQREQGSRVSEEIRVVKSLIQQNFKFQNYCGQQSDDEQTLRKKSTADLHKIVKKRILERNACVGELDELVDQLKNTTESYLHNNYNRKKIYYSFLFVVTSILSIIIFFAQLCTFATFLMPANVLRVLGQGGKIAYAFNVILTAYIAYIVANSIFRIKVYKIFALHKKNSSASSLLFTAINLSRVSYPLCFNYEQITDMPLSEFLQFFGKVTIAEQYTIIFPILLLLFAFFNMFDICEKVAGYLGMTSYAFDDEEAEEKIEEGRIVLIERFKQRNLQNNQLEMIQLL